MMTHKELLWNCVYFTHPVTGMTYKKLDGAYYFKSTGYYKNVYPEMVKSGMKTGFIQIK